MDDREYHITVTIEKCVKGFKVRAEHAFDAWAAGVSQTPVCKIEVRPVIEMTYQEGFSRYPGELHSKASVEAFSGWCYAQSKEGVTV